MNRRHYAHARTGKVRHLIDGVSGWYSGMMLTANCGQRVQVDQEKAPSGNSVVFPVGTCRKCAASIPGGTVRKVVQ